MKINDLIQEFITDLEKVKVPNVKTNANEKIDELIEKWKSKVKLS